MGIRCSGVYQSWGLGAHGEGKDVSHKGKARFGYWSISLLEKFGVWFAENSHRSSCLLFESLFVKPQPFLQFPSGVTPTSLSTFATPKHLEMNLSSAFFRIRSIWWLFLVCSLHCATQELNCTKFWFWFGFGFILEGVGCFFFLPEWRTGNQFKRATAKNRTCMARTWEQMINKA